MRKLVSSETEKTILVSLVRKGLGAVEDRIIFAAMQEMDEHGVKFTMDDLAKRLGISKKTLYQYFPSKDEVFSRIVDAIIADVERQECEIMDKGLSFGDTLKAMITIEPVGIGCTGNDRLKGEFQRYRPDDWAKLESFHLQRIKQLAEVLEKGMQDGYVRPINSRVAARMLYGGLMEFIQHDFLTDKEITFTDILHAVTDVFLYGVLKQAE